MPAKITFSPYAWAKLLFMRDQGSTEVAGFGITFEDDPLYVYDFCLIPQKASSCFVEFKEDEVTKYIDDMLDEDIHPANSSRIWIHTHPGSMPKPSSHDEREFSKVFSEYDWRIMFIVDKKGAYSAALEYKNPNHRSEIKMEIDYFAGFNGSEHEEWLAEYKECVDKESAFLFPNAKNTHRDGYLNRKPAAMLDHDFYWDTGFYSDSGVSNTQGDAHGNFSELEVETTLNNDIPSKYFIEEIEDDDFDYELFDDYEDYVEFCEDIERIY